MLTLAVVDDLGTIAVIAIFFTHGLSIAWLAAAAVVVAAIVVCERIGVLSVVAYLLLAAALWLLVFESGVHATIAGVILGFLTPAVAFHPEEPLREALRDRLSQLPRVERDVRGELLLSGAAEAREGVSPLVRLEQQLHPWSAYAILPIFALANAGVPVSLTALGDALTAPVGLGVALGLVVGAPIGGFLLAYASARFGPGRMPQGLDWAAIAGVTPLKGIGFTIAIFIAELAFDERAIQDQAKLAILVASGLAAVIGLSSLYTRDVVIRRQRAGRWSAEHGDPRGRAP